MTLNTRKPDLECDRQPNDRLWFGYSDDERESSAENLSSVIESDTQVVRRGRRLRTVAFGVEGDTPSALFSWERDSDAADSDTNYSSDVEGLKS